MRFSINDITKEDVERAFEYIDENGVPYHNESITYDVLSENGNKYPVRYTIAVALHLKTNDPIDTFIKDPFSSITAKNRLENLGFDVHDNDAFTLTVTANGVECDDRKFDKERLYACGKGCKASSVIFEKADGEQVKIEKGRQTMPRLAFQAFEKQILDLSEEERKRFPVVAENLDGEPSMRGIFSSEEELLKSRGRNKTKEEFIYTCRDGTRLYIYSWGIFRHISFVQECLRRFGEEGDKFILTYRRTSETAGAETTNSGKKTEETSVEYKNKFSNILLSSKNIIFHGAPGTGKTYLARQIAADIVSEGATSDYNELNDEQKERIGFVQFHPSYDYTDFVEGLRPVDKGNGTIGFELRDGVFKSFVERAMKGEAEKKYVFIIDEINRGEIAKIFGELFFSIDPGYRGKAGEILTQYANMHENPNERFYIPENVYIIGTMNDIDRSVDTFDFAMRRRFRFIELKADECAAMLDSLGDKKGEAVSRMKRLNKAVAETPGLGEDYQIGPAYFLKAKEVGFDKLYEDHLEPLLREYVRGMDDEEALMKKFKEAYEPQQTELAENKSADEDTENQG